MRDIRPCPSSPGSINNEQTMSVPCSSLHNFDERRDEIIEELMDASMNRMQSADIARQAVLENAEKVATEVHFVPKHLSAAA
ncbi:uncharacterized protein IAS62_005126 [Cryptococcus decagattii]|uniref:Uncharacterized protein n=1 Tax=Cryptococcus decagattii TaxID=1859122 RepID=A0ABZ2AZD4_9TREE